MLPELTVFTSPGPWALALVTGLALDLALGEARRWHPLVGFGRWAQVLERRLNRAAGPGDGRQGGLAGSRPVGLLAWMAAVLPPVLVFTGVSLAASASGWLALAWLLDAVVLYLALGARSLFDHVRPVAVSLVRGDLPAARGAVQRVVTRDCSTLDEAGVAGAAVETTLENGNDAVFGTLFWFAVAGGTGALVYRLANTLDAMWGYRTERFLRFGWAAARIDDALNWVPARLTAASYALSGRTVQALQCWRSQAPAWDSPNAGPVMAAGAGALALRLGGEATYHGRVEHRPPLGAGETPKAADVDRALVLVARSLLVWLLVLLALAWTAAL